MLLSENKAHLRSLELNREQEDDEELSEVDPMDLVPLSARLFPLLDMLQNAQKTV